MLAYHLIEIAERFNKSAQRLVGPFIHSKELPQRFRDEAKMLLARAESLLEQVADAPDIDALESGLQDFRVEIDRFIKALARNPR